MPFQDFHSGASLEDINQGLPMFCYTVTGKALQALRAVRPGTLAKVGEQVAGQYRPPLEYLEDGVSAVAAIKTLTFSGLPTADETVVVGGKTYTYKSSPSLATEVAIGANATAAAQNLKAKINTDTSSTLCTAAGLGATLTLTANTPGTDFTLTENLTNVTAATLTANGTETLASKNITLTGTPVTRTGVGINLNGLLIAGNIENFSAMTDIQSGDTLTTIMARLVSCLQAAQDGDNPPQYCRYRCTNRKATKSQIGAGVALKYGTTTSGANSFASSGAVLTITALAGTGADANLFEIGAFNSPAAATKIPTDQNGVFQLPGIELLGYTTDLNVDISVSRGSIPTDQQLDPIAKPINGSDIKITLNILCTRNSEVARKASATGDVAYGDDFEQFFPNLNDSAEPVGFLFSSVDPDFNGQYLKGVVYDGQPGGLKYDFKLRSPGASPLEISVNSVPGGPDKFYIERYYPSITPA